MEIKEVRKILENIDNDEFDETQIIGVTCLMKNVLKENQYKEVLEFLKSDEVENTRNNVFDFIFELGNVDLTPYEIED